MTFAGFMLKSELNPVGTFIEQILENVDEQVLENVDKQILENVDKQECLSCHG